MIREHTKTEAEMELLKFGEKELFEINCPSIEFDERFYEVRFKSFFDDKCKLLILWQKEIPVAYIALDVLNFNSRHSLGRVTSIFVLEKYRRQGFAKLLIKNALSLESINTINLQVYSNNEAALGL